MSVVAWPWTTGAAGSGMIAAMSIVASSTSLLDLAGDALRGRIAQLEALFGTQLQLAHRNLADMSDDDLRTLLADVEDVATRKGLNS